MGQWVELNLRQEQLDMIINCLESKCCQSNDFHEIEQYVYLIENLEDQQEEYYRNIFKKD